MEKREPLSQFEKERIYTGRMKGESQQELAEELHCSIETVRKWWRVGRRQGLEELRKTSRGRKASGMLSAFDPRVAKQAEFYKRQHHGWGADRVRIELGKDRELLGLPLPKRSRLAAFFKQCCPDCLGQHEPRPTSPASQIKVTAVHAVWQMDSQEMIPLGNGDRAVICNVRDPYGAAPITSRAFCGKRTCRSRKLTVAEYIAVLRMGFTEWQTLPDSVWTDNELRFIGNPSSDFPGLLTLYLVGLGIHHIFIRPGMPTDHAQVERGHRTFDNLALNEEALQDVEHLQLALDRERWVYLHEFPCHASDCHGRPPLIAHPELLRPRHFYQPELEPLLFSMQRVYNFLATYTFERKVSTSGCVSLTHQVSIGRQLARQLCEHPFVWIRLDPQSLEWRIFQKPVSSQDPLVELARRPLKRLDFQTITGLDPCLPLPAVPVQLPLPFLLP